MINQITTIYHLIMVILAQIGQIIPIQIDPNWDSEDPACYNDHNAHAIFTFHLYIDQGVPTDKFLELFESLLERYRAASGVQLGYYQLEHYSRTAPKQGQDSIYLSVYL